MRPTTSAAPARRSRPRALRALLVGLRAVEESADTRWAAAYLEGFAAIAAESGEYVHAGRMQGAAEACAGGEGPESVSAIGGATTRAIVESLGMEAYERARSSGRRLSLRAAASEARRDRPCGTDLNPSRRARGGS